MKAFAYLRVSTVGQVEGDGFDRQRATIEAYASTHSIEVVEVFAEEGISGTKTLSDRPALSDLICAAQRERVPLMLVEKSDRLARDLIEGELILREMRHLDVRVIECEGGTDLTTTDNPTAKLIRQVLGAVAEFEKDAVVAKLLAARRRKGRLGGRPRYGSKSEEKVVLEVARRFHAEGWTGEQIARRLNELGHRNSVGRPFTRQVVWRLLRQPPRRTGVPPSSRRPT